MANSKGRSASASHKAYYAKYDPIAARRRRIERHLKRQPNDVQAQAALKDLKNRRQKPQNENGWLTREMTQLGFYDTDKRKANFLDQHSPKTIAWLRSIIRKSEAKHRHSMNYAPKAERQKGGKARS